MTDRPSQSQPGNTAQQPESVDAIREPSFDEKLQQFWAKNQKIVLMGCALVFIVILAKGGWEYLQAQKEVAVTHDYAVATTTEKLKAFAAANPGHVLTGVAHLRLADEAYTAGKGAEAVTNYEVALKNLQAGPLTSRAQLGLAMAKVQAGQTTEGETALQQIADRTTEFKGVRLEAAYQLASLALASNRADDVKKYADQIIQIDASSPWAQRVMNLRATEVAPVAANPTTVVAPATTVPEEPAIKLSVPGGK
ncbi:MAG: tetratricopeptide repeat protein [Opitutaceae bacterium]|nr:tetratricopeptide repeat protein [Opitutaceae bacterium]